MISKQDFNKFEIVGIFKDRILIAKFEVWHFLNQWIT
jgi:hypothetical protein